MSDFCGACNTPFIKKKSGYDRRSCAIIASPDTLEKVFGREVFGFLCTICVKVVTEKTVPGKMYGTKKRVWPSSSVSGAPTSSVSLAKKRTSDDALIKSTMSDSCGACNTPFVKKKSGYNRRSCAVIASPDTLEKVFGREVLGFLCLKCVKVVNDKTVLGKTYGTKKGGLRRRVWPSSTTREAPTSPDCLSTRTLGSPTPVKSPTRNDTAPLLGMSNLCGACNVPFGKQKYDYGRLVSSETLKKVFGREVFGYLCFGCVKVVQDNTILVMKDGLMIRVLPSSIISGDPTSPVTKPDPTEILFSPNELNEGKREVGPSLTSNTFKRKASMFILNSRYRAAFRLLADNSKSAKKAIVEVVLGMMRQEIVKHTRRKPRRSSTISSLEGDVTLPRLQKFNWETVNKEVQEKTPVLFDMLDSALPSVSSFRTRALKGRRGSRRHLNWAEASRVRQSRLGLFAHLVFASSAPKLYKLVPSAVGVELWRQECSKKVFSILNHMGISLGTISAKAHVDSITKGHAEDIMAWKSAIVRSQQTAEQRAVALHNTRRKKAAEKNGDGCLSFSVGWDNIQLQVHTEHQTSDSHDTFPTMAFTYGVRHRVPSLHLVDLRVHHAVDIPPEVFLPTTKDYETFLRPRLVTMVERILVSNIPCLSPLSKLVTWHIPHRHTKAMKKKSEVVNLGLVEANPDATAGALDIMSQLHAYVPASPNGDRVHTIPCSGNQFCLESMTHAKRACLPGITAVKMCQGLLETPQEFDKEGLLLQDTMDTFFNYGSVTDRGTLAMLRVFFNHKNLKPKVKEKFRYAWDFLEFVTEGLTILSAMKLAGMESLEDVPVGMPQDENKGILWLHQLANRVVERCWMPYSTEDLKVACQHAGAPDVVDDDEIMYPYCSCKEDAGGPMVQCCNNLCPTQWFHLACLIPPMEHMPHGNWYCSHACARSPGFIYCSCQLKRGGEEDRVMLRCKLMTNCRRRELYHLACVTPETVTQEGWYCSEECALEEESDDGILQYTKGLMWQGLQRLANRDAVREGDGPAMLQFWRLNMPDFWMRGHAKYFSLGHLLLANTNGFQPARLVEELTWDRVANPSGSRAKNIPLDQIDEFLNKDLKEMLKKSQGNYTTEQITSYSHVGGMFGKHMDRIFRQALGTEKITQKKTVRYTEDLKKFVQEFQPDALVDYLPPRSHSAFPDFVNPTVVRAPEMLGRHIHSLSHDLDFWRDSEQRRSLSPPQADN